MLPPMGFGGAAVGLELDQLTLNPGPAELAQRLLGQIGGKLDERVFEPDVDVAEIAAVQAALDLPWTTSPAEGQISRLKMLKRSMYGRAGFKLLRARVLQAA